MNASFECIEKHLYRYPRRRVIDAVLRTFTDWKKKRRTFPLGSDLKTARDELKVSQAHDIRREDFYTQQIQGITFRAWGKSLATKVDLETHAGGVEREKRSFKTLDSFFGDLLLPDGGIDRHKGT